MMITAILRVIFVSLALSQGASAKDDVPKGRPHFPPVPKISAGEYAVFIEDKYLTFKTKKFEDLELDLSCFKKDKPQCEAFQASQSPPPKMKAQFHPAANFCEAKGGRNLVALDHKKSEYNFCRFKDNSMVNSWSLYLKQNPKKIIK